MLLLGGGVLGDAASAAVTERTIFHSRELRTAAKDVLADKPLSKGINTTKKSKEEDFVKSREHEVGWWYANLRLRQARKRQKPKPGNQTGKLKLRLRPVNLPNSSERCERRKQQSPPPKWAQADRRHEKKKRRLNTIGTISTRRNWCSKSNLKEIGHHRRRNGNRLPVAPPRGGGRNEGVGTYACSDRRGCRECVRKERRRKKNESKGGRREAGSGCFETRALESRDDFQSCLN